MLKINVREDHVWSNSSWKSINSSWKSIKCFFFYIYIYKEKSFFETLRLIGDTSVSPAFHLGFCQRLWLDWVGQSHRLNFDV
jgi:hypothetical protein